MLNLSTKPAQVKRLSLKSKYLLTQLLYFIVATYCWAYKYFAVPYNNYKIFEKVYYHTRAQINLYADYPLEYYDENHYGPIFSIIIAPFALLPTVAGLWLFDLFNAFLFVLAVHLLPLSANKKMLILLCCAIEFANSIHAIQINPVITALIILAFLMVEKGKDEWATLFIVLGTLIKIYPIVALAFFMFSKNRLKFILSGLFWLVVLVCLPMLISSKQFILQTYVDWYHALVIKNANNVLLTNDQDLSIMGVFRHLANNPNLPNTPFLVFGAFVFLLCLFRVSQYRSKKFRMYILASTLMIVVLFSTGSEPPTYIIAVAGAMIWLFLQDNPFSTGNIIILVALLVITGLAPTDALPKPIRMSIVVPLQLKVWPCGFVWLKMSYEMIFKTFKDPDFFNSHKIESKTVEYNTIYKTAETKN